jgi:hypothetical protein
MMFSGASACGFPMSKSHATDEQIACRTQKICRRFSAMFKKWQCARRNARTLLPTRPVDLPAVPSYSSAPQRTIFEQAAFAFVGDLGREHKMHIPLRRLFLGWVSLICLFLPACMEVPVCIPELSYVAPVDLGKAATEVHAFRVDVREKTVVNIDDNVKSAGGGVSYYEFTPVSLSGRGTVSLQWDVSWAYGWRCFGIWNYWPSLTTHSVAVRLYRRGYQTVELRPSEELLDDWTRAADLEAEEKAVDDLLGVSPLESTSPSKPVKGIGAHSPPALEFGTTSAGHRKTLLFAASEYEWLAHQLSDADAEDQAMRNRLLEKERRLKDLARGKFDGAK